MKCPYCSNPDTKVIDSRPAEDNNAIRRRRQCDECGKRFTTYEKIETEPLSVIKKDKTRQLYDRNKIRNGIVQSCHKLPVSMGQIEAAIDEIETKIYNMGRRRACDECGKRFTTYEKVETIPLIIIKKDNNREQYDRAKIEAGILRACYKRPVSAEAIQRTIEAIETEIFKREEKEISSNLIGEIVMEKLKNLDPVAYVRFASVYREFKDVNTFVAELKKILDK